MYIEASGKKKGNRAVLERNVDMSDGNLCLTFYYHMKGYYIGTLNAYVGSTKVFSMTASQGAGWKMAQVSLPTVNGGEQLVRILARTP